MTAEISRVFPAIARLAGNPATLDISIHRERKRDFFPYFLCPPSLLPLAAFARSGGPGRGGYAGNFPFPIFCVVFLYQPMCYNKTLRGKPGKSHGKFPRYPFASSNTFAEGGPGCDWQQTLMGDWHEEHPQ